MIALFLLLQVSSVDGVNLEERNRLVKQCNSLPSGSSEDYLARHRCMKSIPRLSAEGVAQLKAIPRKNCADPSMNSARQAQCERQHH